MIDFGGWEMPVEYTGIIGEHQAVRTGVGVFDVSHMGEIEIRGPPGQSISSTPCAATVQPVSVMAKPSTPGCSTHKGDSSMTCWCIESMPNTSSYA